MIDIIKRLSVNIPRDALWRIYKSFIRPHFDHGDIIYDKPNKESFKSKIENIQYKVCLQELVSFKESLVNAFIKN